MSVNLNEIRQRIVAMRSARIESALLAQIRDQPEVDSVQSAWFHGWVEITVVLSEWTWDAQRVPSALIDAFARDHVHQFSVTTRFRPTELQP